MPRNRVCCVCGVKEVDLSTGNSRSFFAFPKIDKRLNNPNDVELLQRRIASWKNVVGKNIYKYYGTPTVCSEHFHSGKPSYMYLEKDIDWIPSKNMGNLERDKETESNCSYDESSFSSFDWSSNNNNSLHSTEHSSDYILNSTMANDSNSSYLTDDFDSSNISVSEPILSPEFYEENTADLSVDCRINVTNHSELDESASSSLEKCRLQINDLISLLKDVGICNPEEKTISEVILDLDKLDSKNVEIGFGVTDHLNPTVQGLNVIADQIASMVEESVKMKETIASLEDLLKKEKELLNNRKLINRIRGNDKMTMFYTGLKSWALFEIIHDLVLPGIEYCSIPTKRSLPTEEQFLLVLMKLRLNLAEKDLAYRFHISQNTVSTYLTKWIDVMYCRLARNFMVWPTKEALEKSTPTNFRKKFPGVVSIIDCFEIPLERFFDLLGRSSTYSSYKSRNTLKYFISITPSGSISYISQGYGGRATDVQITLDKKNLAVVNDETFLDKLNEGDVVLADRGFLVEVEVKKRGAILRTPSFVGRRSRLTRHETVYSRKVSNLRIHVERVIGKLRRTYKILTDRVPITCVRSHEEKLSYFDKVVFVCCCLTNANPSVVPNR